jgi:hypothetical protein
MNDLFPLTQKEQIYEYIKSKGRVFSHELNQFCVEHCINNGGSRARELKADGLIWHVRADIKMCIKKDCREEMWSVYDSDK